MRAYALGNLLGLANVLEFCITGQFWLIEDNCVAPYFTHLMPAVRATLSGLPTTRPAPGTTVRMSPEILGNGSALRQGRSIPSRSHERNGPPDEFRERGDRLGADGI